MRSAKNKQVHPQRFLLEGCLVVYQGFAEPLKVVGEGLPALEREAFGGGL